jgi:hypothetical protein
MSQTHAREDGAGTPPGGSAEQRFREILCADIDIRIARDGTWYHEGGAIRRKPLVKLFASVLRREADGAYYLVTPAERRRIAVEDAPFVAVEVTAEGEGASQILSFRTNVDDVVAAGPEHPIRVVFDAGTGEPSPYVHVRDGLEALIARPVYYELVGLGRLAEVEGCQVLGVDSGGAFFVLGRTADDA